MAYSGPVFSWDHNWRDNIPERLTWLTDVMTHRDDTEQRRTPRLDPRRQLEYSILPILPREKAALENFLWAKMGGPVMLPIWTDAQILGTAAAAGQPVVTVATPTFDYDAGAYLCLWRDWLTYEVVEIQSVAAGTVTLAENLIASWPVGTVVLPARLARLVQQQDGSRWGGNVSTYRLTFEIDEASRSTNRVNISTPTQYLGIDVYTSDSDWSETLPMSLNAVFGVVDNQTGMVAVDSTAKGQPILSYQHSEKMLSRAEISAFLGFLSRRAGRRVPFWTPTQEDDFTLLSIGFNVVTVESCGYSASVWPTGKRRHVAMIVCRPLTIYSVGDQILRGITAAVDNGDGTETLNLYLANVDAGDVGKVRLSLLRYCRLESDAVEMTWYGSCAAAARLGFRELASYPAAI